MSRGRSLLLSGARALRAAAPVPLTALRASAPIPLIALLAVSVLALAAPLAAQQNGGWGYAWGDAGSTRHAPLSQIDRDNFEELEVAWVWRGDNYGPSVDNILRATPIYAEGKLFTVAGQRRAVIAIDPATGETLWMWRMRHTKRWEDSMRKNYGKGVAYDVVDGRGRIYVVDPGFYLIALDAETGRPVEAFGEDGIVDLLADLGYPYDGDNGLPIERGYITNSSPPVVDITVDGERIPAVVQTTKQSFAYVFNRETGEPVWPIEERPVPASDVPGEWTAPTQPFPTRPAPYEQQGITEDDLIDFTPELRAEALELVKGFRMGPLFAPPSIRGAADGTNAALVCPGANGGTNIPGGSVVDPETGILYVASTRACSAPQLFPGSETPDANMDWVTQGPGGVRGPQGLPLLKPPYGRITAVDLNTGEHLWWIPNGDTPDNVKNHPALAGVELPVTGKGSHATALVTPTLLIYGEGRGGAPLLHAVDKRTGEELATVELPAPTNTAPMTFMHEGVQYIVSAVSGGGLPGSLVALRIF
ncbi:MAG: PQQ-binding-like beta-propeller repeat protein [Gemmatimonadota bacterium]